MRRGNDFDTTQRAVTYCLVPGDLAARLHEPLVRHFADEPSVQVVVERRGRERRHPGERRDAAAERPGGERRRIVAPAGRRVADRRAVLLPSEVRDLPRRARPHAARLMFVERIEPRGEHAEDADSARLVTRFQAGDQEAFSRLYMRYFDRVYTYLRVALNDTHEAEDATQQVMMKALEALPRYEHRGRPFRAWLFTIVRHHGIEHLRRHARLQVTEPAEVRGRCEQSDDTADLELISWIADAELVLFIQRLPHSQRQVLVLRYMLGLSTSEIAAVLERSEANVRMLHSRALRFLRERLSAVGRAPARRASRPGMRRRVGQASVLRERRFALASPWTGASLRTGSRAG